MSRGRMARSATGGRPRRTRRVLCVIEPCVEALETRKRLERWRTRFQTRVADSAHRTPGSDELLDVAVRTCFVTGEVGLGGICGAAMTGRASERRVSRRGV